MVSAQAPREPGEPPEVAPPLFKLFEFLPPFIMVVGIAMFVTDTDPAWLAVVFIVAGVAGSAGLRRLGAQQRSAAKV